MTAGVVALAAFAFVGIFWAHRNDNLTALEHLDDADVAAAVEEWSA